VSGAGACPAVQQSAEVRREACSHARTRTHRARPPPGNGPQPRRRIDEDDTCGTISTPSNRTKYRYDALGRRVYTRVVRGLDCPNHDPGSGCKSLLTRTVWDGDQVLYEIRLPGDTGAALETDAPAADSTHGVVGYLHAGGIDQPLAIWKSAESVVFPFADYRGVFVTGTCPAAVCGQAWFPAGQWTSFGDPPIYPNGIPVWHGSTIEGGRDASGYQYKRNRYYDPNSGRFTQEDPIGLAGGFNLYGFAGGDPVNFGDPFGLCPEGVGAISARSGGRQTTIIVCADGTVETRRGGNWTWRNNNPGNLRASGLAVGKSGGFAVFSNRTVGNEAEWRQFRLDANRGLTLGEMITKYAPPKDKNNTQAYIAVVSKESGVDQGSRLSELTEQKISDIIRAMQRHEGSRTGTVATSPQ
jgi:RHS repeat-associated protein